MTVRPSESDRLRRCEPAFGQLNRPMEPTSQPQRHRQSPMLIRLNCVPHGMLQDRPMAWPPSRGAEDPRVPDAGSPSGSPELGRGGFGTVREASQGTSEARQGPPCAEVRPVPWRRTRVNRVRTRKVAIRGAGASRDGPGGLKSCVVRQFKVGFAAKSEVRPATSSLAVK